MPEPNATVDPFDSAGVRLPTEGKGYSCTDSATDVKLVAALGAPVPSENAPGTGVISVDIPFAAEGEVIECEWGCGIVPDNTNLTPATLFGCIVGIADSATIPFTAFMQSGSGAVANLTLTDVGDVGGKTAFAVPAGIVYPLTVFLAYSADGDALISSERAVALAGTPAFLKVQRVKRERVLQMPPATNLI